MLVSGGYVMILDPSGIHLPPRNGKKRTALFRPLASIIRQVSLRAHIPASESQFLITFASQKISRPSFNF